TLTATVTATIGGGTNLSISMIPFTAAITNEPTVNGINTQLNGNPIPNVTLSLGVLPNTLTLSFIQPLPLSVGDVLRIRAIRINDQASGVIFPDQIRAELTVTPPGAIQFDQNNIVPVSTPLQTLNVTFATIPNLLKCLQQSVVRPIIVTEQSPAVFTSRSKEGDIFPGTLGFSNPPPATNGAQLEILLTTVPGGLTVSIP